MEQRRLQYDKVGVREAQELGHASRRLRGPRSHGRLLAGTLAGGEHVGWAVVHLDYVGEMGPLHGMHGSMETEFEVQRTIKRGGDDSFFVPPQQSMCTHQDSCGQHGNICWITKKVRKSVLSQEKEMQTCG